MLARVIPLETEAQKGKELAKIRPRSPAGRESIPLYSLALGVSGQPLERWTWRGESACDVAPKSHGT